MNVIQLPYGSLADLAGYFNTNGKILAPGEVFIQYTPGGAKFEDLSSTTTYSSFDGKKVDSTGAIVPAVAGDGGLSTAPDGKVYDQNGLQIRKVYNGEMFAGTGRSDCYVRIGSAEALKFGGLVTEADSIEKAKNNPYRLYLIVGDTDAKVDVTINLLGEKNEIVTNGIPTTEKEGYGEGNHLFDYIFADAVGNVYYFNQYSAVGTKVYINATGNGLVDETFGLGNIPASSSLAHNGKTVADFEKDTNVTNKTLKDLINTVLPKYCHYEGLASDILNDSATISGSAPSTAKGAAYYCDLDSTTTETTINYYHLLPTDAKVTSTDTNVTVTDIPLFSTGNEGLVNNYTKHDRLYEGDIIYFEEDNTINVIPLGYLLQSLNHVNIARGDEYATQRWASEDNRVNAITKNLSEAIALLSKSKADLDPVTLKLITSEIPDWLLSAPKYQSTITETQFDYDAAKEPDDYDQSYELFGTPKSTAATDAATYLQSVFNNLGFTTATVTAKDGGGFTVTTTADVDSNTDEQKTDLDTSTDSSIVSGMYWIYNGAALSLTKTRANANEVISNNIIAEVFDIPDNDDGELHPGDWVIWNGTKGLFEKLDHSDNLTSINVWVDETLDKDHKGTDHALTYVPTFTTATREVNNGKAYLGNEDTEYLTEAEFESDDQRYTELGTDNAVLTTEDLANHGIIIGNGNKSVVESAEIIANKTAGFDITPRKDGVGDNDETLPVTTTVNFQGDVSSYTIKDKVALKPYVFDRKLLKALRIDLVDADGNPTSPYYDVNFDFAYAIDANGKDNSTSIINANYNTDSHVAEDYYGYLNTGDGKFDSAKIYLPTTCTGTLTTVEYVNEHIELLEKLINAAYSNLTSGTEDYIQLIWVDTDDVKHVGDSYIANIITTKDLSKLYSATSSKTTEDKLEGSRTLTIFNDLTFDPSSHEAKHGDQFNHNIITTQDLSDATVGVEATNKWHDIVSYAANDIRSAVPSPDFYGNVGSNQINPTGKKQINNYMPNHSGILLNNFSVIDCGYWVASKLKSTSETKTSTTTAESSNGAN